MAISALSLKKNFVVAGSVLAALAAGHAIASGSDSFPSTASRTDLYNAGKQVFAEKLACKGCAFDGKSIDKDIAKQIVSDKKVTEKLSDGDRDAVMTYAKKRFRLN